MPLIRHNQPVLTRLSPHQANNRYLKSKSGGGGGDSPWPNPGSAFYALAPDPDTGQMTGVINGTGDLTTTHTADLYAPDYQGVYQKFPANAPVWAGGRCELAGGPGTDVVSVWANDAPGGAPLPEVPYLQYYPAAENMIFHSRDLSQWTGNAEVKDQDQTGIDGTPNTAWTVGTTTGIKFVSSGQDQTNSYTGTEPGTVVWYIKKDAGATVFPGSGCVIGAEECHTTFNIATGVVTPRTGFWPAGAIHETIDLGDWWKFMIQHTPAGVSSAHNASIYAGVNNADDGAWGSFVGDFVLGQAEIYFNKTIAEVRGLGPIFTTTAAVATDRTAYSFDGGNHAEQGCYYMEQLKQGNGAILDTFLEVISPNYQLEDGLAVATQTWTENTGQKLGTAHAGGQMAVNVDNAWGVDQTFAGTLLDIPFDLYRGGLYADKIRDLRRYDETDYASAKTIIDGLMT